ncbi:hypothetical protein BC629DRAFT_1287814 [Irpex lacteus]|nr:hypothetical protein BC629DRAFT_1287836 [Irpex lacteus]KAI0790284.1 hypothetical protein BC629DRAFT_1287814 [Irpex lacteus]
MKEAGLLHKIGSVTADNASNNGTAFVRIAEDLRALNIAFDAEGNRIGFYADALAADPVGRVRSLVAACRASGQRREDLRAVIINGNETGRWESIGGVPLLQLLRDCPTRWSSTYMMVDRALRLYPALAAFLSLPKHVDVAHHALTDTDIDVLEDIHDVLQKSADVQQAVSGETAPTVAFTFPVFEGLINSLMELVSDIPILQHYIKLNVLKLKQYFLKCRRTRIFALAMCTYYLLRMVLV